jgi:hypothetical protein
MTNKRQWQANKKAVKRAQAKGILTISDIKGTSATSFTCQWCMKDCDHYRKPWYGMLGSVSVARVTVNTAKRHFDVYVCTEEGHTCYSEIVKTAKASGFMKAMGYQ